MALIRPFCCVRPAPEKASEVAALPYDVYDRQEAREEIARHPLSFLAIDRPDAGFPDSVGSYEPCVYEAAKNTLAGQLSQGVWLEDKDSAFYLYELTMDGRSQTGIVACASADDYRTGVIKKHENTREEKEQDRIRHIDTLDAQTGPIFLAYRPDVCLKELVETAKKNAPIYDFVSDDGIGHRVWKIADPEAVRKIGERFAGIPAVYIADGHHRAASAVKVCLKRREGHPEAGEDAEFNGFLSVLFSSDELRILPYNRVVRDLNGLSTEAFLEALSRDFSVREIGTEPYSPSERGRFGLYLDGSWYELTLREGRRPADPVGALDVSVLQELVFDRILGIHDPRTDSRIDFVGGIRGLGELERRASADMKAAFSMYPTSMDELLEVADAGLLMPPKSTWFEPKLRSGLFIHRLK